MYEVMDHIFTRSEALQPRVKNANGNAIKSIGIETGEYGVKECYHWIKDKHGTNFWGCEWKCSTTCNATNKDEFGSTGDSGDKSTKPRGSGCPCLGRPRNDAHDPHANAQECS